MLLCNECNDTEDAQVEAGEQVNLMGIINANSAAMLHAFFFSPTLIFLHASECVVARTPDVLFFSSIVPLSRFTALGLLLLFGCKCNLALTNDSCR